MKPIKFPNIDDYPFAYAICEVCGFDLDAKIEIRVPHSHAKKSPFIIVEPCRECLKRAEDRAKKEAVRMFPPTFQRPAHGGYPQS